MLLSELGNEVFHVVECLLRRRGRVLYRQLLLDAGERLLVAGPLGAEAAHERRRVL